MSIKLTDTQLVMLSAAAQREDRCIEAPPSLKSAAAQKIATKLVAAGLVKEMKAKPGARVWRRDDATGQTYVLKLTAAGLNAIAVEDAEAAGPAVEISPPATAEVPTNIANHEAAAGNIAVLTPIAMPREGSKLASVVDLLRREDGATVEQLADAMGWLPHTTRAALTGLRKRGFGIDRRKGKDQRAGAYVIVDHPNAAEG
jgi:predicted transcriptional regulator